MNNPSRRDVLRAGTVAVAAAMTNHRAEAASTAERPNVLWLVSEDNNPLLGCYGDGLSRTPNIDALARRGLLFRNVFCAAPVCAPSRFAILTGVHPESLAPANHMRATAALPAAWRTYPQLLREAGYYCTNNAKTDWNCDADAAAIFDASGSEAHWKNRPAGSPFMAIFNCQTSHESSLFMPSPARGAAAQPSGDGVVRPGDVRVPAYLPDTPEIREDRANYYNAISRMDAEIGARVEELEDAGLADNTIIFYYSDNGGVLPRSKRYCYDEGLRCALVVAFPPKWVHLAPAAMGGEINAPVGLIDLAPTVLSLAGIPAPAEMQGTAFLGRFARSRGAYAFGMRNRMDERYDFVRAATDGRFHYIRNYTPHRVFQHEAYEWQAKGYQSWEGEFRAGRLNEVQARFFAGPRTFEELYDLRSDPDQIRNLANDEAHADRLKRMRAAVDDHMLAVSDNGFIPEGMTGEGYAASRDRDTYPLPRLMKLGAAAAQRDRANLASLLAELGDQNPVVRHWAILGLLMLGKEAASARERLERVMRRDEAPQNRIAAAEAVACVAPSPEAVAVLADLVDHGNPWPVALQALNALTFLGEQARAALPAIKRAASGSQEYLRNAGRYLEAVLEGRYAPSYPVYPRPGAGGRG